MSVSLIVAMAENRVIGHENRMPWHLPADLNRFRSITTGKPILMGRRTHESIGRTLPDRMNIVITGNPDYQVHPGSIVVHSLADAIRVAGDDAELMVIGGAKLYQDFLPDADRIYLTLIHRRFEGDTCFPAWPASQWKEVERINVNDDHSCGFPYSFITLVRQST
jgi:dihydrofolate reductase